MTLNKFSKAEYQLNNICPDFNYEFKYDEFECTGDPKEIRLKHCPKSTDTSLCMLESSCVFLKCEDT